MANAIIGFPFAYTHLDDSGIVHAVGGDVLHSVIINHPDATAAATVTMYDGVDNSGDVIAVIAMDKAIYVVPVTLIYDIAVTTGIYAEFSHTDGADITVTHG